MNAIPNFFILIFLSLADHAIIISAIGFAGLMYSVSGHRNQKNKPTKLKIFRWLGYLCILLMFCMFASVEVRGIYEGHSKHETQQQADEEGLTKSQNFNQYLIGQTQINLPAFENQWYQALVKNQEQHIKDYQNDLKYNPFG